LATNGDHYLAIDSNAVGPDGQSIPQVLISLTQTVTILAKGQKFELYRVSKSVDNASKRKRASEFLAGAGKDPLRGALL
jgi:hypothetical protein